MSSITCMYYYICTLIYGVLNSRTLFYYYASNEFFTTAFYAHSFLFLGPECLFHYNLFLNIDKQLKCSYVHVYNAICKNKRLIIKRYKLFLCIILLFRYYKSVNVHKAFKIFFFRKRIIYMHRYYSFCLSLLCSFKLIFIKLNNIFSIFYACINNDILLSDMCITQNSKLFCVSYYNVKHSLLKKRIYKKCTKKMAAKVISYVCACLSSIARYFFLLLFMFSIEYVVNALLSLVNKQVGYYYYSTLLIIARNSADNINSKFLHPL